MFYMANISLCTRTSGRVSTCLSSLSIVVTGTVQRGPASKKYHGIIYENEIKITKQKTQVIKKHSSQRTTIYETFR